MESLPAAETALKTDAEAIADPTPKPGLTSVKLDIPPVWRFWVLGIFSALALAMVLTHRWHAEDYLLFPVFIALPWFGPGARRLSFSIAPFLFTGIVYDLYGQLMPYRGAVHVDDLFRADLALFGVPIAGGRMLLPDWLAMHAHPLLDALTGAAYILYLAEVFLLGLWFHFRAPPRALMLGLGFLLLNFVGMVIWFSWPAAPPWYVALNGLGPANMHALPSPAGTARFDQLIGFPLFHGFYSRSVNVFGAMPSLHCAYPTLTYLVSRGHDRRLDVATFGFAVIVVFSSMYLQHHYALDALAGIGVGCLCFLGARWLAKQVTLRLQA